MKAQVEYTNGLATITLAQSAAMRLWGLLCANIRQTALPDDINDPENVLQTFENIHVISRMCYEIVSQRDQRSIKLSNLSLEDVIILYDMRLVEHGLGSLQNTLNAVRFQVRPAGPIGLLEADKIAKDLVTVLES